MEDILRWKVSETVDDTDSVLVQPTLTRCGRLNKENIPSRAYIAFKSDELLATFSREYDGHLFRDKSGERC
jgi:Smg-4/UPF3 family